MNRAPIIQIVEKDVLDKAASYFGSRKAELRKFPEYEGAANLVYEYDIDRTPLILRISFSPERTQELIQAELNFINYLSENGVNVSRPVPSQQGNWIETVPAAGIPFHIVSFVKAKGTRVPDNGYRYRTDAPIEEYYRNWGRILGQMHALAKNYKPESDQIKRPDWFDLHHGRLACLGRLPDRLHRVQTKIFSLLDQLRSLPRERDSYGLIHGDFNDGNFTVDYTSGEMTVFDFDDSSYFWFIDELASAWVGGTGRTMFRGLDERKSFMEHYMAEVMDGYTTHNSLSAEWLDRLPLFIKLVQVEEFLHYVQYLDDPDEELQGRLNYFIQCLANDIPYMGFFDGIFSPEKPFSL